MVTSDTALRGPFLILTKERHSLREFLQVGQLSRVEFSLFRDILGVETARPSVKSAIRGNGTWPLPLK